MYIYIYIYIYAPVSLHTQEVLSAFKCDNLGLPHRSFKRSKKIRLRETKLGGKN